MTNKTKRLVMRNFAPPGALKRGTVFLAVCALLAVVPAIAHALS